MIEEKVSLQNEYGITLVGVRTQPESIESTLPTVILAHGFGVTKEEYGLFDEMAEHLAGLGILSYRFDFTGCGESEGDYSTITLTKLAEDLNSIVAYVKEQKGVDSHRVGIWGQSFGTSTVVAAQADVKALALSGSLPNPFEKFSESFDEYNPDGISIRKKSDGRVLEFQANFWKDFEQYDLVDMISRIEAPILFVHGTKDVTTPIKGAQEFYDACTSRKKLVTIEGADHGLQPCRQEVYKIIGDYFAKEL